MSTARTLRVQEEIQNLESDATRPDAEAFFGSFSADDAATVPVLLSALEMTSVPYRWTIVMALELIGPAAAAAGPALVKCLTDDNEQLRQYAAMALRRVGLPAGSTPKLLRPLLEDEVRMVRVAAATALLILDPPALEAVQELCEVLATSQDVGERYWAANGLAEAVAQAPEICQATISLLDDWNDEILETAAHSLADCPAEEMVPVLLERLQTADDDLRAGIMLALSLFGEAARPLNATIVESLLRAGVFEAPHQHVRSGVARVVAALGLDDSRITQRLEMLLNDYSPDVRDSANTAVHVLNARDGSAQNWVEAQLAATDPTSPRVLAKLDTFEVRWTICYRTNRQEKVDLLLRSLEATWNTRFIAVNRGRDPQDKRVFRINFTTPLEVRELESAVVLALDMGKELAPTWAVRGPQRYDNDLADFHGWASDEPRGLTTLEFELLNFTWQ